MCNADPSRNPRPNRIIRFLSKTSKLTVLGAGSNQFEGIHFVPLETQGGRYGIGRVKRLKKLLFRQFDQVIWPEHLKQVQQKLAQERFHLIIVHDIDLLPLALRIKNSARILLDAREYYPKQFEDRFLWRIFCQPLNEYLCCNYLPRADRMITVSDGIARQYANEFGVQSDVFMSLPDPVDMGPSRVDPDRIRIIHHGNATPSRRLELMIEMMDLVDGRFHLDLMLVDVGYNRYFKKLRKMANRRPNVSIIPPVPFENVILFTNQYDIGLFLVPPVTFNLKYTLPNKLFEFIQARLAVAIGPSVEMRKILDRYDCGIVAPDYDPGTLARALNELATNRIVYYKTQSDHAASELSSKVSGVKLEKIISEMCKS
jgi:glycosyltransferase involved in cell wall biosynthesis